MDEAEVKSRTITLGELWDILNTYDVPVNAEAQSVMIAVAKQPKEEHEPCLFCRLVDTLRGIFPWM